MQSKSQSSTTAQRPAPPPSERQVRIIGVPSGIAGRSPGPQDGPAALREAGIGRLVEQAGRQLSDIGDIEVAAALGETQPGDRCKHQHAVALTNQRLAAAVKQTLEAGEFPLVLGGDHSFAIGSLAGAGLYCEQHGLSFGVLWIDAHPDINTPDTTPSGNIHGMPVAAALGLWQGELARIGAARDLQARQLVYLALRSIDPGEAEAIARLGILAYSMDELRRLGMPAVMQEIGERLCARVDHLHVSFDLDSADPAIAPGVSTPEPNGLNLEELALIMRRVAACPSFASLDIAELNPALDRDGMTARLGARVAAMALDSQA
jgi:arginase